MRRADRFDKLIEEIVGPIMITKTSPKVDMREASDYASLFEVKPLRIAARVRNYRYFEKYKDEFTIRYGRNSGQETELHKIVAGHCDYTCYSFADPSENPMYSWFLGALTIFRK